MVIDLRPPTLVDAVADAVRQRVLAGEIKPGARVTEQDIADLYRIARPTAKAAIERIVQIGILRRTANKTACVPLLSHDDIEDLYRSRIFFEREVVVALAEQGVVPEAAERALDDMQHATRKASILDRVSADIDFHRALVDQLGSARLRRMYETILGEAHLCMAQEEIVADPKRKYDEHRAVLDAIAKRDVELASRLMSEHLASAATRLLGRPFEIRV